ncbi:MAG: hypothetical protein WBM25_08945 [Azonexus sp.]|jgi:hypothetical protein
MQTRSRSFPLRTLSLALTTLALPAAAAPTVYEMRLMTHSGMGAGGMGGIMSMLSGGGGSSVSHNMDLRLASPGDLPADYQAAHTVPDAMRIGPQLPLQGERRGSGGSASEGEPDGRVLIYWGCSPTVPKGQPEVIDFRAMTGKVPPEIQAMARQSRSQGKAPRDASLPPRSIGWPQGDQNYRGIPDGASAVGDHVVKANFMKDDIRFALTPALDFLEPMGLKAQASDLKAAIPLAWNALTRARGYDLQAVSAGNDKDIVMWLAARNKSPMLPASQHECTIPEGIFAKGEMAMLTGIAHGPVQGFSYPPQKPGEKKPLIWSATVNISAFDSVMLGMEMAAAGAAKESAMPGVGDVLKGLFGR